MVKQVFRLIYIATALLTVGCTSEMEEVVTTTDSQDSIFTYTMYFDSPRPSYEGSTRINNAGEWENGDVIFLHLLGPNEAYAQAVYNSSSKNWTVTSSSSLSLAEDADCDVWCAEGEKPVQSSENGYKFYQYDYMTAAFSTTSPKGKYTCSDNKVIFVNATLSPRGWRIRFKGTPGAKVRVEKSDNFLHLSKIYYDGKFEYNSSKDNFELTVGNDGYTDYFAGHANSNCSQICVTNVDEGMTYSRHFDTETLKDNGGSGCYTIPTVSNLHGWTSVHEYVDLGFPSGTLWATCNVGANSLEECGDKYALGEVETKSEYTEDNYHYSFYDIFEKHYSLDDNVSLYSLKEENDVAAKKWGKAWSMPSLLEGEELYKYCTQEEVTIGDQELIKYTSKINGNSIYLLKDGFSWMKSALADETGNNDVMIFAQHPEEGSYNSCEFTSACVGLNIRPVCHSLPIIYPHSAEMQDSTLSMTIGERRELKVSVFPENASFKFGVWQSGNTKVVTVNEDGVVTAVGKGKTTVTFSDPIDVFYQVSCSIEVFESHDFVDLGLPSGLKWATCNVGANSSEEYGDYFAWGETEPKDDYSYYNYKHGSGEYCIFTKYTIEEEYSCNGIDNKYILDPEDDAAYVNWGPGWRMPTEGDLRELYDKCGWEVTTKNGICGYRVTGPNDKTIFLPAAGWKRNEVSLSRVRNDKSPASRRYLKGEENSIYDFFYWSSCLRDYYSASSWSYEDEEGRGVCINDWPRYIGMPVRPVVREWQH